jgi:hypothetical protein
MVFCLLLGLALLTYFGQATIKVYSPDELKTHIENLYGSGEMPASLANFGNPPYGTYMIGKVFLPTNTTDGYPLTSEQTLACSRLPYNEKIITESMESAPILLVDRGRCPFVTKVRNAEDVGFHAVLVVDNIDEDPESIIMGDSGAGGNLAIPSFLISKGDGMLIREAIL